MSDRLQVVRNPCDPKCPNRSPTCHGTCEAYSSYRAYLAAVKERKQQLKAMEARRPTWYNKLGQR